MDPDGEVPGVFRCSHCHEHKPAADFMPSQRRSGSWCRACFKEEYRKKRPASPDRPCESCGVLLREPLPKQRFCSTKCKNVAKIAADSAARIKRKARNVCGACGNPTGHMRGNALWCSNKCAIAARIADGRITPAKRRAAMLAAKYGITAKEFDALLAAQDGRCAICKTDEPNGYGWCVDHCHESSKVRGILCTACNTAIGHLRDDPARIRAAAEYVERNQ